LTFKLWLAQDPEADKLLGWFDAVGSRSGMRLALAPMLAAGSSISAENDLETRTRSGTRITDRSCGHGWG